MDLSESTTKYIEQLQRPLALGGTTELKPVFDPVFHCFSVQLWRDGAPAGLLGMVDELTHPDDVLENIDAFLEKHDESPLNNTQMNHLGGALIMAKGGSDAYMLIFALEHPENFIVI